MYFTTTTTRSVTSLAVLLLSSALTASDRDVPQNVRDFYNKVRGSRECANPLASGFWSTNWGTDGVYFILFSCVPSPDFLLFGCLLSHYFPFPSSVYIISMHTTLQGFIL